MPMKLLLASAVLALGGTIATAQAAPMSVPLTASDLGIWSGATPGSNRNSANQQALPDTRHLIPLISATAKDPASGPIFVSDTAANTVGGFLSSGPITDAGCGASCRATELSAGGFAHATLFEFSFTTGPGMLTIAHDDGVSLFADGGGGNNPVGSDLFPIADSAPTTEVDAGPISLKKGSYDLFYSEDNGLPSILQTDFVASRVPEPGSLVLLGVGLLGLGVIRRRKA